MVDYLFKTDLHGFWKLAEADISGILKLPNYILPKILEFSLISPINEVNDLIKLKENPMIQFSISQSIKHTDFENPNNKLKMVDYKVSGLSIETIPGSNKSLQIL